MEDVEGLAGREPRNPGTPTSMTKQPPGSRCTAGNYRTPARPRWYRRPGESCHGGAYTVDEAALRHGAGVEAETNERRLPTRASPPPSQRRTRTAGCRD